MKDTIYKKELDDIVFEDAVEYGINKNTAKKLSIIPKIKNTIKKQNTNKFGSRKPKEKNHKQDSVKRINTYLTELEDEEKLISDSDFENNIFENADKKMTLKELKNL